MAPQKTFNPFYILLVLAGVVFFITASAYGVMTVKGLYPEGTLTVTSAGSIDDGQHSPRASGLMEWLDKYGFQLLMVELIVLAIFTFAAISTDSYWLRRKKYTLANRNDDMTEKQPST